MTYNVFSGTLNRTQSNQAGVEYQIKSNQIYLPTQNMKEKKTDEKPEVTQNQKNRNKLEC